MSSPPTGTEGCIDGTFLGCDMDGVDSAPVSMFVHVCNMHAELVGARRSCFGGMYTGQDPRIWQGRHGHVCCDCFPDTETSILDCRPAVLRCSASGRQLPLSRGHERCWGR